MIGFALVVYKIGRQRSFWWLIRAQLIALALTVMGYSIFPVDYLAHWYNASQVASGYLRPSVMIAVKPISNEGVFPLLHLTEAEDPHHSRGLVSDVGRAPRRDREIAARSLDRISMVAIVTRQSPRR